MHRSLAVVQRPVEVIRHAAYVMKCVVWTVRHTADIPVHQCKDLPENQGLNATVELSTWIALRSAALCTWQTVLQTVLAA
jgi:hypothetical protein